MAVIDKESALRELVAGLKAQDEIAAEVKRLKAALDDVRARHRAAEAEWAAKETEARKAFNVANGLIRKVSRARNRIMSLYVPQELRTERDTVMAERNRQQRTLDRALRKLDGMRNQLEKRKREMSEEERGDWRRLIDGEEGDLQLLREDLAKTQAKLDAAQAKVDEAFEDAVRRGSS